MRFVSMRSYQEFVGKSARFSLPTGATFQNRMVSNLLYYQTNYFVASIIILLLLSLTNPNALITGLFLICVCIIFVVIADVFPHSVREPKLILPVTLFGALLLLYFIGHVLHFLAMLLVPSLLTLLHAFLRQRNIKAKLSKLIDSSYPAERKTPMSLILDSIGVSTTSFEVEL